jgi:hypothetical protein
MPLNETTPVHRPRDGDETKNVIVLAVGVTVCDAAGLTPSRSVVAPLQPLFASTTVAVAFDAVSNSKPAGVDRQRAEADIPRRLFRENRLRRKRIRLANRHLRVERVHEPRRSRPRHHK